MDGADGLTWDHYGQLFISSWKHGQGVGHPAARARSRCSSPKGFQSAADTCLDPTGKFILVPDMKARHAHRDPGADPRLRGR